MDALTEAIVRLLRRLDSVEQRLAQIERGVGISSEPARAAASVAAASAIAPAPATPAPPPAAGPSPPSISPAGAPPAPPPSAPVAAEPHSAVSEAPAAPPPSMPQASAAQQLETRMGLTWINRAGVVTLVLGVAFFFKYAIDNQWIGEAGRVVIGVFAGLAALGLADRLWRRGHQVYAQGVCATGIAVLYLAFYASFGFYHLVPQGAAFLLMLLTTTTACALAIRYNARAVVLLALLGGYATPILLSTGVDRPWFFFSYVALLDIAALALARRQGWDRLTHTAFFATLLLYSSWFIEWFGPQKRPVATLAALVFYGLFASRKLRFVFAASQWLVLLVILQIWSPPETFYLALALALSLAGLAMGGWRGWPEAVVVVFGAYWVLFLAWYSSLPAGAIPAGSIFLLLTPTFLLFLGWTLWTIRARRAEAKPGDLAIVAANAAFYFGACYELLERDYRDWRGLLAATLAALHLGAGAWLWKRRPPEGEGRDARPALLLAGIALAFLTLAVPIQLSGYRITMAWALQAAALAWIGARTRETRLVYAALAVFLLALLRLQFIDAFLYSSPTAYQPVFNARFLTFAISAACLWAAAWWIGSGWRALSPYVTGHYVMLWALGLEVADWAARAAPPENVSSAQSASLSILMAAYAVALASIGVAGRSLVNRVLGLGLIALVVLKLYLYDVWLLARLYRILAFSVLGALLLAMSFLYSRYRAAIESWWRDDKAGP